MIAAGRYISPKVRYTEYTTVSTRHTDDCGQFQVFVNTAGWKVAHLYSSALAFEATTSGLLMAPPRFDTGGDLLHVDLCHRRGKYYLTCGEW